MRKFGFVEMFAAIREKWLLISNLISFFFRFLVIGLCERDEKRIFDAISGASRVCDDNILANRWKKP